MWRILLLLTLAHVVHSSCPVGFDLSCNVQCKGSYGNMSLTPVNAIETAVARCKEIHGEPVIIHNAEDQAFWMKRGYSSELEYPVLLLGISCNSTSTKWEWVDGSSVDFLPDTYSNKLDAPCICDFRFWLRSDGYWHGWTDADYTLTVDVSCTVPLHPLITDTDCVSFADDSDDGVCYQVGDTAESWQDAQMICKKLGANLASIHNLQENSFVRRLAVSKGAVTGLYLGATTSGKGKDYGWIDGSEWNYDNFAPGFPKQGFGECIGMDTASSAGQWKNIACTQKLPVACMREHKNITEPICSTETWIKEGSIITSPGFPYTASTPCDFYLMVDDDKQVEVEIILLEANSCTDKLVIYDGYFGKELANLSGEVSNVTYTTSSENIMLVSWQPNGGKGVMGLAMTFRGV